MVKPKVLLDILLEAEMAVGILNALAVKAMLRDAQDVAIEMERQLVAALAEADRIKLQLEVCRGTSLHRLSQPQISQMEVEAMGSAGQAFGVRLKEKESFKVN